PLSTLSLHDALPICIRCRSLHKTVGDFGFRLAQNNSCLSLALRLRLSRHGIFQPLRDLYVSDLNRLHRDAPRIRLLIENALQFRSEEHTSELQSREK